MWQLWCIATWDRPMSRQWSSALILTPMPSLTSLHLSTASYGIFTADMLCYAVTFTSDPVTFDRKTLVLYWLCYGQNCGIHWTGACCAVWKFRGPVYKKKFSGVYWGLPTHHVGRPNNTYVPSYSVPSSSLNILDFMFQMNWWATSCDRLAAHRINSVT